MSQAISGPGVGLPYPQNLYPSHVQNAPHDMPGNQLGLAPGSTFVIPAGNWYVSLGMYNVLQFLDPVTNVWTMSSSAAYNCGLNVIKSDGFTVRVANLTGCVVSASVINGGTGYAQATTTITAIGAGFSGALPTLLPIVGGALGATGTFTIDIPTRGAGYGVPPLVLIPPPPPAQSNANGVGGIPATAIAIIGASGSLTSISVTNPGAGYPVAPVPVIVPSPFDPNLSIGITQASAVFSLTSAGIIMGALVTNNGSPLANGSLGSVTLSVGGAGTSGSLTANVLQTVVSGTLTSAGTGYGTTGVGFVTAGGGPIVGITGNPIAEGIAWLPRPANIAVTASSLSVAAPGTIYDGGLFESAPILAVLNVGIGGVPPTTIAALTVIMGSRMDVAVIQPAP